MVESWWCYSSKAGKELLEECKKLGGCETDNARITNDYNLPCLKVFIQLDQLLVVA